MFTTLRQSRHAAISITCSALFTRRISSFLTINPIQLPQRIPPPISESKSYSTSLQWTRPDLPPSTVLLLLGLEESPQIKEKLANFNPTSITFHPKREQTTFIDFPGSHTAARAFQHALKARNRMGIKKLNLVRSKRHNDERTLMIVGGSNEYDKGRRLKRLFKGFFWDLNKKHFRILREREPYAVAKFASIDAAIHAREVLTQSQSADARFRKIGFGKSDVDEEV